jgi:hypothetical protein
MCCPMRAGTAAPASRAAATAVTSFVTGRACGRCGAVVSPARGNGHRLHEEAGRDGRARARRPARSSRPGSCTCCSGAPPRCPPASPTRAWPTGTASPATCAPPTPGNPSRAGTLLGHTGSVRRALTMGDGASTLLAGVCDRSGARPRPSRTRCAAAAAVCSERRLSLLPCTRTTRGCDVCAPAVAAARGRRGAACWPSARTPRAGQAAAACPPAASRCSPALRRAAAEAQARRQHACRAPRPRVRRSATRPAAGAPTSSSTAHARSTCASRRWRSRLPPPPRAAAAAAASLAHPPAARRCAGSRSASVRPRTSARWRSAAATASRRGQDRVRVRSDCPSASVRPPTWARRRSAAATVSRARARWQARRACTAGWRRTVGETYLDSGASPVPNRVPGLSQAPRQSLGARTRRLRAHGHQPHARARRR